MTNDEIYKKLESKNVKPTAMRTLVFKTLVDSSKALSLSDLEQRFDRVERSTIYRSLKTFEENFIVHPVDDGTGSVKYAVCDDNCTCSVHDLHVHFYCTSCGKTYCLKELSIPNIKLPEGYTFNKAQFIITGVCPHCK